MPVLVVKFPDDNAKKVNMSRFLSKHKKREFSVIIDIEKEDMDHIFEVLNRNECKVFVAQDQSMKIDYEIFFLLYILDSKLRKKLEVEINKSENMVPNTISSEKKTAAPNEQSLFYPFNKGKMLKKILSKFLKNSDLYLSKFEKDYIISKDQKLFFDWEYRLRVLFDSITISARALKNILENLDKENELDNNYKLIYAIYSAHNTLGDIANFTGLQDVEELQKLEELITLQIIHKNPYRLSATGNLLINFINDNLKQIVSFKIPKDTEKFLEDLIDNEIARQLSNLLITLCLLTIKNRIEIGYFPFNEFENLYIDPKQYK